jgi:hypothetical protein
MKPVFFYRLHTFYLGIVMPAKRVLMIIRVITKLLNTEQSSKGKDKTHKSTKRQNKSTTGNSENRNGPDLVVISKEMVD